MGEGSSQNSFTVNRELRPNPDPSSLTTDQIFRENAWVEKLFKSELDAIRETLLAMAKALELVQAKTDREPSPREVQLEVQALAQVVAEHHNSIEKQFGSVAALASQLTMSNKESLALALQAQKESAGESKTQTERSIEKMEKQSETALGVRDVEIKGIDRRLTLIEGRSSGMNAVWAIGVGAIGVIATLFGLYSMMGKP